VRGVLRIFKCWVQRGGLEIRAPVNSLPLLGLPVFRPAPDGRVGGRKAQARCLGTHQNARLDKAKTGQVSGGEHGMLVKDGSRET
jgi:hypothetical protein